jgi:hypothetical protein
MPAPAQGHDVPIAVPKTLRHAHETAPFCTATGDVRKDAWIEKK